jgi:hypothetical protein
LVATHGEADQGSPTLNRVCTDFPDLLLSCQLSMRMSPSRRPDARTLMRELRRAVVSWLVAPAQRALLRSEPGIALTFEQYERDCR